MVITGSTKVYGIIGWPVSHSLSPLMHNAGFAALAENRIYIPLPAKDIAEAVAGLRSFAIEGASVTIPHKEAVLALLDEVEPIARKIGAVNTIEVMADTHGSVRLRGLNTDWLGANRALAEVIALRGSSAVLLGAGGSARAIGFGLLEAGCTLTLCSRTESRGRALAAELSCEWLSLDQFPAARADILVNATSVGMHPHVAETPVAVETLATYQVVMDIVYAPLRTALLTAAAEAGCITVNGLEMLLYQGAAQFELWTGKPAPVAIMRQALLRATDAG